MPDPYQSSLHTIVKARTVTLDAVFAEGEEICRSLWIGGEGNVEVLFVDGTTAIYEGVLPGRLEVQCTKVIAAGTTVTETILAEY